MERNGLCENNNKKNDESTAQHCHESELGDDLSPKKKEDKSIEVSDIRIIYLEIISQ